MGARSKHGHGFEAAGDENSRVPRWGHDQNIVGQGASSIKIIAECPDGGTIKTSVAASPSLNRKIAECPDGGTIKTQTHRQFLAMPK